MAKVLYSGVNEMNETQNFEFLDILTILSFYYQLKNLELDNKYESYIKDYISRIDKEIQKLHEENEEILKILKSIKEKEA